MSDNNVNSIVEYLRVCNDINYFAAKYVKIKTTDAKKIAKYGSNKIPFTTYGYQKVVLDLFAKERYCVVLKPRQMGITTLMALYALWTAITKPNNSILIVTIKNKVAKDMLVRIKDMYRSLPDFLKMKITNGRGEIDLGNSSTMVFSNGSVIEVVPNTPDAGRGGTYNVVISDETAFQKHAKEIWTSIQPAMEAAGQMIFCSTAFGYNFFQTIWHNAVTGVNGFFPVFLEWRMHPNRTDEWYWQQVEKLGKMRVAQEIDCEFALSGYNVFDIELVKGYEVGNIANAPKKILNGRGYSFDTPKEGFEYFIGADISTGRARDKSAYTVMDSDGNIVETFSAKIDVTAFSELLVERGIYWNNAVLAPENNSYGQGVVTYIQTVKYPKIFVMTPSVKKVGEKKPRATTVYGWTTSEKSRTQLVQNLADDFNKEVIKVNCPFFLREAYTFVYNEKNKAIALGKDTDDGSGDEGGTLDTAVYTDDNIMSVGIANMVRKLAKKSRSYVSNFAA